MEPFKHEIQKKKWDKLRKKKLITAIAIGGCSALAFAGIGVGIGYALFKTIKKELPEFKLDHIHEVFEIGQSGDFSLHTLGLPNDYHGRIMYNTVLDDDENDIYLHENVVHVSSHLLPKIYNLVIDVDCKADHKYNERLETFATTINIMDLIPEGYHRIPNQNQTNIWIDLVKGKPNLNWMIFFNHSLEAWNEYSFNTNVIGGLSPIGVDNLFFIRGGSDVNQAPQIHVGCGGAAGGFAELTSGNHWRTKEQINTQGGGIPIDWYEEDEEDVWFSIKWTTGHSFTFSNSINFPGNDWLRNGLNWFLAAPNS